MSTLHTKLRSVPFLEDLICRDLSGCRQWGKGKLPPKDKERYLALTDNWKTKLGPILGYRNRKAPNQITGHLCDLFLHEDQRQSILELIDSLGIWENNKKGSLSEKSWKSSPDLSREYQ